MNFIASENYEYPIIIVLYFEQSYERKNYHIMKEKLDLLLIDFNNSKRNISTPTTEQSVWKYTLNLNNYTERSEIDNLVKKAVEIINNIDLDIKFGFINYKVPVPLDFPLNLGLQYIDSKFNIDEIIKIKDVLSK